MTNYTARCSKSKVVNGNLHQAISSVLEKAVPGVLGRWGQKVEGFEISYQGFCHPDTPNCRSSSQVVNGPKGKIALAPMAEIDVTLWHNNPCPLNNSSAPILRHKIKVELTGEIGGLPIFDEN
jgi:hypothetical protein